MEDEEALRLAWAVGDGDSEMRSGGGGNGDANRQAFVGSVGGRGRGGAGVRGVESVRVVEGEEEEEEEEKEKWAAQRLNSGVLLAEAFGAAAREEEEAAGVNLGIISSSSSSFLAPVSASGGAAAAVTVVSVPIANNGSMEQIGLDSEYHHRPQLNFPPGDPDNSRAPFVPKIKTKPHAIVPLSRDTSILPGDLHQQADSRAIKKIHNPYEAEIRQALYTPPEWIFRPAALHSQTREIEQNGMNFELIRTVERLDAMIVKLGKEDAIGVDLENHSFRSFLGFSCLMQISTRTDDFLIDSLLLRGEMQRLNVIFANHLIVKIMHGSDHKVEWLQRDFGIYVVSLFDTAQAAKVLGYSSTTLSFSLQLHCGVQQHNVSQSVDWRIRPLKDDMVNYAREKTHYLPYIFDKMRNELLNRSNMSSNSRESGIMTVLGESAGIALKTYEKPLFSPDGYRSIHHKEILKLPQQLKVLEMLYEWRDRVAREEDESYQYVLPVEVMIRVSAEMPRTLTLLEQCCASILSQSRLLQQRLSEILEIILVCLSPQMPMISPGDSLPHSSSASLRTASGLTNNNTNIKPRPVFVPITIPVTKGGVTFAPDSSAMEEEEIRGGKSSLMRLTGSTEVRERLLSDSERRATPSPVLTTDQLFDTAGWHDVHQKIGSFARGSQATTTTTTAPSSQFGGSNFVIPPDVLVGSTMHTQKQKQSPDGSPSRFLEVGSIASPLGSNSDSRTVEDVNAPVDPGVIEDEDPARSLKEIYRISNRNRKRNKEKNALKKNGLFSVSSQKAHGSSEEDDSAEKKLSADEDILEESGAHQDQVREDAIAFMKKIGWIAPESEKKQAQFTASSSSSDAHESSDEGSSSPGSKTATYEHKMNAPSSYSSRSMSASSSGERRPKAVVVPKIQPRKKNFQTQDPPSSFENARGQTFAAGGAPAAVTSETSDSQRQPVMQRGPGSSTRPFPRSQQHPYQHGRDKKDGRSSFTSS